MIRLIYALIVVFLTIRSSIACEGTFGENGHSCNAGEYWDLSLGRCKNCPKDSYCPKTSGSNGIAYCCPGPFSSSDAGSDELQDCYAAVTCGETSSNPLKIYCDKWDTNKKECKIKEYGIQYQVQSSYDTANIQYPNSITLHQKYAYTADTVINTSELPDGYHIETIPHYTVPPNRDSQTGWEPSSFTFECVANTMPCTTFIHETHPCTGTDNCNDPNEISASLETSKCPVGATIVDNNDHSAYATWDSFNSVWDVSGCARCKTSGNNTRIESANCFGSATMLFDESNNDINIVHTIRENIIFNDQGASEVVCSRCFPDENDGTKYYLKQDNQHPTYDISDYTIHACIKSDGTENGYYRDETYGRCNMTTGSWGTPRDGLPCERKGCPPGQTTTGLPIGKSNCKYSTQTQFCDAKGCFKMTASELTQWGLN